MLFNSRKEITYREIKESMKFDDEISSKNLKSFMFKNYRILER